MIRIEHLRKEYANVTPLKDVSVTINNGDVISVIGPSGTGKSTLIRCIDLLAVRWAWCSNRSTSFPT